MAAGTPDHPADMTATEVTGQGRALPGRLARSLRRAGLSGVSVAGAGAAGALVSVRAAYPRPPTSRPTGGAGRRRGQCRRGAL